MSNNLTEKLIAEHLVDGTMAAGEAISLQVDQTLCQDATGTLVMLTLEAMELDRVKTEVSAQYVDHNLIQEDHKNPDDHGFLLYAAQRFGVWYSRAGNGISHPLHTQHFARPGKVLIGSDSHTCANGCMGMLAMGAGGADVALAMAGKPLQIMMPEVHGVELKGKLPDWVSAKDIILEMLRRFGVSGGVGKVYEYFGDGLDHLDVWDRHVIANMGAELGATASVFPADKQVETFMKAVGREDQWQPMQADKHCRYDSVVSIDLSELQPLIAKPGSPGNVVPVTDVAGEPMQQAYIGSSANPAYRDYAMVADIVAGKPVPENVSLDINPATREVLLQLTHDGRLAKLLEAGARLHQAGCNGCIGMGQAPATNANSLRTTPRNFPGRSGTLDDKVWLCSPETAAASALKGEITDPRELDMKWPEVEIPAYSHTNRDIFWQPSDDHIPVSNEAIGRGPNIVPLPAMEPVVDNIKVPILLDLPDDVSTDEILPAGAEVLPYRSNIPKISEFAFRAISDTYVKEAETTKVEQGHAIVAGHNYGQGSSREHAALALAYLGLKVVIAKSYARIHFQNLVNFGVVPLTLDSASKDEPLKKHQHLSFSALTDDVAKSNTTTAIVEETGEEITLHLHLSERQRAIILAGGIVHWAKQQKA